MPSMKHHGKILDRTLPKMEGETAAAFLDDFATSEDADKPITSGLFRLEAGEALTYTYTYHEIKLIVRELCHLATHRLKVLNREHGAARTLVVAKVALAANSSKLLDEHFFSFIKISLVNGNALRLH